MCFYKLGGFGQVVFNSVGRDVQTAGDLVPVKVLLVSQAIYGLLLRRQAGIDTMKYFKALFMYQVFFYAGV